LEVVRSESLGAQIPKFTESKQWLPVATESANENTVEYRRFDDK
jgi:hypothetical protein